MVCHTRVKLTTQTHTHKHTHTDALTLQKRSHTYTHTHTHAHPHQARTHTHIYTHTHRMCCANLCQTQCPDTIVGYFHAINQSDSEVTIRHSANLRPVLVAFDLHKIALAFQRCICVTQSVIPEPFPLDWSTSQWYKSPAPIPSSRNLRWYLAEDLEWR